MALQGRNGKGKGVPVGSGHNGFGRPKAVCKAPGREGRPSRIVKGPDRLEVVALSSSLCTVYSSGCSCHAKEAGGCRPWAGCPPSSPRV